MKKVFLVLAIAMALPLASFAQSATPVAPVNASAPVAAQPASPALVVAASPAPSKVESKLDGIVNSIPGSLPAWILALIGILVELGMRFFPTKDPKSMFIVAGNLCHLLGSGFMKISQLIDGIVQNLTPVAPSAVASSTAPDDKKAA